MFERFAHDARAAVAYGQDHAVAWHDDRIGSEHVLAGAVSGPDAVATRALARLGVTADDVIAACRAVAARPGLDGAALAGLGIDLDTVRTRTEATFGAGALERAGRAARHHRGRPTGHIPFDDHARKVLEVALREAVRAGHRRIDTGHLLLAVARLDETPAHRALLQVAPDLDRVHDAVALDWVGRRDDGDGGDAVAMAAG